MEPIRKAHNELFANAHDKTNTNIENHKIIGKIFHCEINYHINIKILM